MGAEYSFNMPWVPDGTSIRAVYLADGWIGVHCFRYDEDRYVVDTAKLEALLGFVDTG